MNKLIIAILVYFSTSALIVQAVKADEFYPAGEIDNCQLAVVPAIQISSIGDQVRFDPTSVKGERNNWIQDQDIRAVASTTYPNAARFSDKASSVSVPPGSKVEIGAFSWNYSGHDITSDKVVLFTSQSNPTQGDLTSIGASGERLELKFNNNASLRTGKAIEAPGLGLIPNRSYIKGKVLTTFTTIQPVTIISESTTSEQLEGKGLKVIKKLVLKNNYNEQICGITAQQAFPGKETSTKKVCIEAGTELELEFIGELEKYSKKISIPGAVVSDPNRYQESAAGQYDSDRDYYNFNARPLYVSRSDQNDTKWRGYQPAWGQTSHDLLKVEIIPYQFTGAEQELIHDYQVELDVRPNPEDSTEILIDIENNGPDIEDAVIVFDGDRIQRIGKLISGEKKELRSPLKFMSGEASHREITVSLLVSKSELATKSITVATHLNSESEEILELAKTGDSNLVSLYAGMTFLGLTILIRKIDLIIFNVLQFKCLNATGY